MALIRSALLSDIRGSIGGTTYSRTRGGAIARNRSVPINPNTVRQAAVRADLNNLAFIFSTLDRVTVESWNAVAASYPTLNRLGESYVPSGKQLFISCGLNLRSVGVLTTPTLPSAEPEIPQCDITLAEIVSTTTGGAVDTLTIDKVSSDNATAIIQVQATPNLAASRGANTNLMRTVGKAVQNTLQNLTVEWNSVFANPAVSPGQIINIRVAAVHPTNGLASAFFNLRTDLQAA